MVTTVGGTDNLLLNEKKNIQISKKHKARELYMITLRNFYLNRAPQSYMT